jgi:ribonucleotide reductase beta subunit family protein with ferritin-like domain
LCFTLHTVYCNVSCFFSTAPPSNEGENEEEKLKKEIKEKARKEFLAAVQFEGRYCQQLYLAYFILKPLIVWYVKYIM